MGVGRYAPKPRLQRDLDRLAHGIAALRIVHNLIHRKPMPGEIRAAMAQLRAAKEAMISDMLKEIDGVQSEIKATHVDGLEAMKLPRAELEQTKQEIREIRAEFAPTSNGGPVGPLPDAPKVSPAPSPPSGAPDNHPAAPETQSAEKKT